MTNTIRIYDPDADVTFADHGLYLARGGFNQSGPEEDAGGGWLDVAERLGFEWLAGDDAARGPLYGLLAGLGRRARANQRPSSRNYFSPSRQVVLEMAAGGERGLRYAILRDLTLPKLSALHWRPGAPAGLRLELLREGLWRGVPPDGEPHEVISAESLANWTDADDVNYVTLTPAMLGGDAPALLRLAVTRSGFSRSRLVIAALEADSVAELDMAPMFFNATDELDNAAKLAADTAAPDGQALVLPAGDNSGALRWTLPDSPAYYNGRFRAYVGCQVSSLLGCTLQLRHGFSNLSDPAKWNGDELDVPATPTGGAYGLLDLGIISLPAGRLAADEAAYPDYELELIYSKDAGVGLSVASLFLVPLSWGVYELDRGTLSVPLNLVADGIAGLSYGVNGSGQVNEATLGGSGRYLQPDPARCTRLFFYGFLINTVDYTPARETYALSTDGWTVTAAVVPRYQYLTSD